MKTAYDIINTLVRTEKGTILETQGKYLFKVSTRANKIEIKKAVEEIYSVKVNNVRTITMPSKKKRVRQELGHTTPWKKAVVTLREGQSIDTT